MLAPCGKTNAATSTPPVGDWSALIDTDFCVIFEFRKTSGAGRAAGATEGRKAHHSPNLPWCLGASCLCCAGSTNPAEPPTTQWLENCCVYCMCLIQSEKTIPAASPWTCRLSETLTEARWLAERPEQKVKEGRTRRQECFGPGCGSYRDRCPAESRRHSTPCWSTTYLSCTNNTVVREKRDTLVLWCWT